MEIKVKDVASMQFKPFHETFPYCTFGLALSSIYPNKYNIKKRILTFVTIITFCVFQIFWFLTYTINCLLKLDILNFARNMTLWIIVILFFFKTIYAIKYTEDFAAILNMISKDFVKANEMDADYQEIFKTYLKKSKFGELVWLVIPIILSSQFPIYPAILMIMENLETDSPNRYMVHEMDMIYVEHIQYTTPFFEIYFAYNMTQCLFLSPIFTGFDGSFCIATNHLCLKLKLMTHKVRRAFKDAKNSEQLRNKMKQAIRDHQEVLDFYTQLSEFYGFWLLVLFLVASIGVSFNLYQIYMMRQIVPKYVIFMFSAILHIYIPCVYASNVTEIAKETAVDLYNTPWESCYDPVVTKYLIFMIARSQRDMIFNGKGLVNYNMQLFISLMQSAYSFYTLITS
ncbi:odorant receptor Or2 [Plodia interpunctella]|uniref:odorant receptor Or2 n=1 Tax=Plodia interpunctella TaxID=58824 RepID=UPI0023683A53|nr:odorant receptor Or2-like [Plodia interpunctella]